MPKEGKIVLTKKAGFNNPLGGDVILQADGMELSMKEIKAKVIAAVTDAPELSGIKVNSVDIYVKPEEGAAYWVAHHKRGEASGSVPIG